MSEKSNSTIKKKQKPMSEKISKTLPKHGFPAMSFHDISFNTACSVITDYCNKKLSSGINISSIGFAGIFPASDIHTLASSLTGNEGVNAHFCYDDMNDIGIGKIFCAITKSTFASNVPIKPSTNYVLSDKNQPSPLSGPITFQQIRTLLSSTFVFSTLVTSRSLKGSVINSYVEKHTLLCSTENQISGCFFEGIDFKAISNELSISGGLGLAYFIGYDDSEKLNCYRMILMQVLSNGKIAVFNRGNNYFPILLERAHP